MTRLRGRAPVRERLIDRVPHGHWMTTTLIGARSTACGARPWWTGR
ncbi:MAG: hypothetical protein KF691_05425 [Phycisphaeraceae bacterium]|nr:hypothetical protein [Phycisphaeraceae bacterium]